MIKYIFLFMLFVQPCFAYPPECQTNLITIKNGLGFNEKCELDKLIAKHYKNIRVFSQQISLMAAVTPKAASLASRKVVIEAIFSCQLRHLASLSFLLGKNIRPKKAIIVKVLPPFIANTKHILDKSAKEKLFWNVVKCIKENKKVLSSPGSTSRYIKYLLLLLKEKMLDLHFSAHYLFIGINDDSQKAQLIAAIKAIPEHKNKAILESIGPFVPPSSSLAVRLEFLQQVLPYPGMPKHILLKIRKLVVSGIFNHEPLLFYAFCFEQKTSYLNKLTFQLLYLIRKEKILESWKKALPPPQSIVDIINKHTLEELKILIRTFNNLTKGRFFITSDYSNYRACYKYQINYYECSNSPYLFFKEYMHLPLKILVAIDHYLNGSNCSYEDHRGDVIINYGRMYTFDHFINYLSKLPEDKMMVFTHFVFNRHISFDNLSKLMNIEDNDLFNFIVDIFCSYFSFPEGVTDSIVLVGLPANIPYNCKGWDMDHFFNFLVENYDSLKPHKEGIVKISRYIRTKANLLALMDRLKNLDEPYKQQFIAKMCGAFDEMYVTASLGFDVTDAASSCAITIFTNNLLDSYCSDVNYYDCMKNLLQFINDDSRFLRIKTVYDGCSEELRLYFFQMLKEINEIINVLVEPNRALYIYRYRDSLYTYLVNMNHENRVSALADLIERIQSIDESDHDGRLSVLELTIDQSLYNRRNHIWGRGPSNHAQHQRIGGGWTYTESAMDTRLAPKEARSLEKIYDLTDDKKINNQRAYQEILAFFSEREGQLHTLLDEKATLEQLDQSDGNVDERIKNIDAKIALFRKYRIGVYETVNARRALCGPKKSNDYSPIVANSFYIVLSKGRTVRMLDLLARVWYLIHESEFDEKTVENLKWGLFYKVAEMVDEAHKHIVCEVGKTRRMVLILQGYIDDVYMEVDVKAPKPKEFAVAFQQSCVGNVRNMIKDDGEQYTLLDAYLTNPFEWPNDLDKDFVVTWLERTKEEFYTQANQVFKNDKAAIDKAWEVFDMYYDSWFKHAL
jgi:hypothetical protein